MYNERLLPTLRAAMERAMTDETPRCPECGEDLTDKPAAYIEHHANYHWDPQIEPRKFSPEGWERRRQLLALAGHKVLTHKEVGG